VAARLLRLWVQIPPGAWIFVCCECRVLSGRGLCDELITCPEESYRLCCVVVCDQETSRMRAPYIYNISSLRVKVTSNKPGVDKILTQQTFCDLNFNAGGGVGGETSVIVYCIYSLKQFQKNCCRLDRWQKIAVIWMWRAWWSGNL